MSVLRITHRGVEPAGDSLLPIVETLNRAARLAGENSRR